MTEVNFPPHIRAALDRYCVPDLPLGFADRLLARADSDQAPVAPALSILRPRKTLGSRWRRSGIVVGSVGLFGMVTAAAAATGFFGEPVYVPVVSEALAQANFAPVAPKRVKIAKPKEAKAVAEKKASSSPTSLPDVKAERIAEARNQIRAMWRDPEFRRLPKQQRRAEAKAALRKAMAQGDFNQDELIQTLRDLRAERRALRTERKAERADTALSDRPARIQRQQRKAAVQAVPPVGADEAAPQTVAPVLQPRPGIQKLRDRLQSATPDERARIRSEIRARRAERRAAQQPPAAADKPLQAAETQDVAEPPK